MTGAEISRIKNHLAEAIGPAPWYWKTFPPIRSAGGQHLSWIHHGESGAVAHLVTLGAESQPDRALLALNTYCRPFTVGETLLGIWCPEGRNIRVACFDADQLKSFDLAEVAGWFKASSDRIYSSTAPIADFEIPLSLGAGTHKLEVPAPLKGLDELIVPTSYRALSNDDAAFALFVLYPQAGLVEVLPQRWFTASQYRVGQQWIPRAARDPETHRIVGECFGIGTFLLEEDGCGWRNGSTKLPRETLTKCPTKGVNHRGHRGTQGLNQRLPRLA